jgi:predicted dehydrogenase
MLNFGIIGTSWITHSFIESAHATGSWHLSAVYSRAEATAKEFASKYPSNDVALYTSLDSLTSDANISTIYIASPNLLHYTQAKAALSAGKHVILEKPSCSTVAELDDLFATARANNVFLLEAFRHIQEANFKILKAALPRLGPLYGASLTFAQYSSRYDKVLAGEVPNIFNLALGGGALVDLGVYCVAAAIDLFGAPVNATYWPVKVATGADGAGRLMLEYANFSVALCHSKIYNSAAPSEIYGEKGTLVVPSVTDIESVAFCDVKTKGREELAGPKEKLNLKEEAVEFARVIEGKDREAEKRYEQLSRDILAVLEKVRKENGLLYPGEE